MQLQKVEGEKGGRYKALIVPPGVSWVSRAVEQDPVRPMLALDIRNPADERMHYRVGMLRQKPGSDFDALEPFRQPRTRAQSNTP